jgi:hypothetical protein
MEENTFLPLVSLIDIFGIYLLIINNKGNSPLLGW